MNTYNIIDFGARPNAAELQTSFFQAAVDKCAADGGGFVEIPGGSYTVAGIYMRSNVTLRLLSGAVLIGSRNPEDYNCWKKGCPDITEEEQHVPWVQSEGINNLEILRMPGARFQNGLIKAINCENIGIVGEKDSFIDGADCYDPLGEEHYRGPHAVNMHGCRNITFKGFTVKRSADWAFALFNCVNTDIENISVCGGHDGVHITGCFNTNIVKCEFYTGDDCVAGVDNVNTFVNGCILNTACSALRFGGSNVLVSDCRIYGPAKYPFRLSLTDEEKKTGTIDSEREHRFNMLSAFTYYADFSRIYTRTQGNIVLENCKIENADRLVHLNFSGNEFWQRNKPMHDITLRNVSAAGITIPINLYGEKSEPVSAFFENVDITLNDSFQKDNVISLCNYKRLVLNNVKINNFKGKTIVKRWSSGADIDMCGVRCDSAASGVADAEEPFETQSI